jgi:phosphinothricin acetyltransferase
MIIRLATAADAPALAEIYGHHVREGLGTFEEEPPSATEMATRLATVLDRGLPWLVADDGGVEGYAYAAPFRTRAAYRYVVEDSVYVAPNRMGSGVGKALLTDLIGRCEALGLRQMIAIIGDSGNAGSMRLHSSLGFGMVGLAPAVGWKHGRWVDVVWMQRALGPGAGQSPGA